jgi:hypothetical protein
VTRRRITDSEAEALLSGHTPPDRADLAATASFLRELPAQLSESEPIELAAPPRRRTRLLVSVAATVAAVIGLAGVVALRGGDKVVRPDVGGASAGEITATSPPPTTTSTPMINRDASGALPTSSGDSTGTSATPASTDPESPFARYAAARQAWNQCVTDKGAAACGPAPDPAAYGLAVTTTVVPNGVAPTTVLSPADQAAAGSSACNDKKTDVPGLEHPDVLTC